jgi:hypothetical protein
LEAPRPFVRGQSQMRFLRRPRTFHRINLKGMREWFREVNGVHSVRIKAVHVLEESGVRHTSDEGCRSLCERIAE